MTFLEQVRKVIKYMKGEAYHTEILKMLLDTEYITIHDVMGADEVSIMRKVLKNIHPYEISLQKDGRWTTYVEDKTTAER